MDSAHILISQPASGNIAAAGKIDIGIVVSQTLCLQLQVSTVDQCRAAVGKAVGTDSDFGTGHDGRTGVVKVCSRTGSKVAACSQQGSRFVIDRTGGDVQITSGFAGGLVLVQQSCRCQGQVFAGFDVAVSCIFDAAGSYVHIPAAADLTGISQQSVSRNMQFIAPQFAAVDSDIIGNKV